MTFTLRDIAKRYGSVQALDGVSLTLRLGQIHGILGENGAGKSTLMNILFGAVHPDRGRLERDGQPLKFASPREAIAAGIGLVHQHFHLVDSFTVRENVWLGDRSPDPDRLRAMAARLGLLDALDAPVGGLPVGLRQRVEILKALYRRARLLLLDEPTAVLTPPESATLFDLIRELRANGTGVVFITHKLREALDLCDVITVLRQGRVVGEYTPPNVTVEALASAMIGGDLADPLQAETPGLLTAPPSKVRLRVEQLNVTGSATDIGVRDVSFSVCHGEVFGIAGVDGNGQTALAEALVGLRPMTGRIWLDNRPAPHGRRARMAAGIRYIPADRRRAGLVLDLSVAENAILGDETDASWRHWGIFLSQRSVRQYVTALVRNFDIRAPQATLPVRVLSGGNQQKLLVARELGRRPSVLVAVNPTWGVDIAAIATIHRAFQSACRQGMSVVLISNELDEILTRCHRFAVLHGGRLSRPLTPDTSPAEVGRLMAGDAAVWERHGAVG